MKNINIDLEKINDINKRNDIFFLANQEIQNKMKINNNFEKTTKKNEFLKYKKDIKNKINELYSCYLDNSNNLFDNICNNNEKYINYFNLFIINLIDHLKSEKIKNTIQNELSEFLNSNYTNNDTSYNELDNNDICSNCFINDMISADKMLFNKPKEKSNNLDDLVKIKNVKIKQKILPKKR